MSKKEEDLQMPSRDIKVKIGTNEYTIKFPTNGQLIDMESLKIQMTSGANKEMLFGTASAREAYLINEAVATFQVLIPDLKKDLEVKSLLDLDPLQSKSIHKAYEKYYNWMEEWRKVLNQEEKKEEDDTKGASA